MSEKNEKIVINENVYPLLQPITFDGAELKSITLDFDKLTGADLLACERQLRQSGEVDNAFFKAMSLPYQVAVAAAAASVPVEQIKALKARDFTQVTQKTVNFLMLGD